jgi:uncharacterized repeat protein (TIGR01451 family)/LPXTG-motif cell wall-anchored protein
MSKLTSLIRRAPKRFSAVVLMVAAAVIIPAAALAWGPDRQTYTYDANTHSLSPALNHVTFNSITNTPNYGDERNFVTIKSTDGGSGSSSAWTDDITVENNKDYYVRMYVHNNAEAQYVAQNVKANFNVPTYAADRIQIDGYLSSSNATPTKIWDQAVFHSDSNFKLQYVEGSAKFTNQSLQGQTRVFDLPDSVVGDGAQLGFDSMNGQIPGCFEYIGYVTLKVKAVTEDFEVSKTVRINGLADKTFKESVTAKPGDKVDYQIYFKNSGGTQLTNVVIKDTLPAGMTYVPGSTQLATTNGISTVADGVTAGGLIIGGFVPGGSAFVKFSATVNGNEQLPACGPNTLRNVAKATTTIGAKEDTADVLVNKTCEPGTISVCEISTKKVITIKESEFNSAKHTIDLSVCVPVPELPKTGPTENIVAIVGLGALIASLVYYIASRRALNQ